jgi:hypothetical protein
MMVVVVMIQCGGSNQVTLWSSLNPYISQQMLSHSINKFYKTQGIYTYIYTEASRVKSISHTKGLLKHTGDIAGL